uniref:Large ribosomal subunit protein bL9c n=1 Tax=Rhizophora mucronata TaxID=61149 RepID=A0A2P2J3N6_RHIMU
MVYMQYGRNALRQIFLQGPNFKSSDGVLQPLLYACQGVRYRKLEVILTNNVEKLGKAGQTVKVAPGYFRNHLMPKLLAVPNIDKFAHLIKEQHKIYKPEEEEEVKVGMEEYERAAKRLISKQLSIRASIDAEKFRARASKKDPIEICPPVTREYLVNEVARQLSVQIEPENIYLPVPLTTFGEFEVPLRLPKSIPLPAGKLQWVLSIKIRGN